MKIGELTDKMVSSDRIVIANGADQTIYRGYVANFKQSGMNPQREVKKIGIGMETYKATEKMWDWEHTNDLPQKVPAESISRYKTGELVHIIFTKITLE